MTMVAAKDKWKKTERQIKDAELLHVYISCKPTVEQLSAVMLAHTNYQQGVVRGLLLMKELGMFKPIAKTS